jgi:CRISPR/Cas system-associated exonuclease Cas4 (RecB family)
MSLRESVPNLTNRRVAMTVRRDRPSVYVTLLSKLLAGDTHCEWAAWFQTQNFIAKRPSDFNRDEFNIKHRALLQETLDDLEDNEYTVTIENQNRFELRGTAVTLAGKPDIIAVRDDEALIIDCKTGEYQRVSDVVQVMIYMWAIPKALPRYRHCRFTGLVLYKDHPTKKIPPEKVTSEFVQNLGTQMKRLASDKPCRKVPSRNECKFCPVRDEDCGGRLAIAELVTEARATTDVF